MYRKIILPLVIILFSSSPVYSTEGHDGNWWRTLQREQKQYYLVGILDGLELGQTFLSMDERKHQTEVIVSYYLNQEKYFKNVTYDQLIDGLDIFFSDFKNRSIEINSGLFVVLKMIRGGSEDEINTMIKTLRSFPIEKEKVLRELREIN